jgi:hypothetical protein
MTCKYLGGAKPRPHVEDDHGGAQKNLAKEGLIGCLGEKFAKRGSFILE